MRAKDIKFAQCSRQPTTFWTLNRTAPYYCTPKLKEVREATKSREAYDISGCEKAFPVPLTRVCSLEQSGQSVRPVGASERSQISRTFRRRGGTMSGSNFWRDERIRVKLHMIHWRQFILCLGKTRGFVVTDPNSLVLFQAQKCLRRF